MFFFVGTETLTFFQVRWTFLGLLENSWSEGFSMFTTSLRFEEVVVPASYTETQNCWKHKKSSEVNQTFFLTFYSSRSSQLKYVHRFFNIANIFTILQESFSFNKNFHNKYNRIYKKLDLLIGYIAYAIYRYFSFYFKSWDVSNATILKLQYLSLHYGFRKKVFEAEKIYNKNPEFFWFTKSHNFEKKFKNLKTFIVTVCEKDHYHVNILFD